MTAALSHPTDPKQASGFAGAGTPAFRLAGFLRQHGDALTIFAVLALVFFRRPDSLLVPQFFGEDGTVFFKTALLSPFSLNTPHGGFLQLIPRLAAELFMALPYAWQPLFYNLTGYACVAFVAASILSPRLDLPCKPLLALCLALAPQDGAVFANLAHLQFVLAPLLPVLLLYERPKTRLQATFDVCVALAVGLTGPFILCFAPFALYRTLAGPRDKISALMLFAYGVPLCAQGYFLLQLLWSQAGGLRPRQDPDIWYEALARGVSAAHLVFKKSKITGIVLSLAFYVFVAYSALSLPDFKRRRAALISVGLGFVIMAVGYYAHRDDPLLLLRTKDCCFYPLRVFMLWVLVLTFAEHQPPLRRLAVLCLALWGAMALYHSCYAQPRVFFDNNWSYHARKIDYGIPVFLPMAPNNLGGVLLPERPGVPATVVKVAIPADSWENDGCWKPGAVLPSSPDPLREYFFGTRAGGCQGEIRSKPFTVDRPLLLEMPLIHGKKNPKDMRIGVRSLTEPQKELLCELGERSYFWSYCALDLKDFSGHAILVFAEDRNSELESWLGFGQPWLYTPAP
jgi:hypothetical protein